MEPERFLRELPILKQIEGLARAAYVSSVTQLLNGAALAEVEKRYFHLDLKPAAVFLDLAGFKAINDAHGHLTGDGALGQVGAELLAMASSSVFPFHKSGDEFVVLAQPAALQELLSLATERMLARDIKFVFLDKDISGLRATVGYALPDEGVPLADLIDRAEAAMRFAKVEHAKTPVQWTPAIGDNPIEALRKHCDQCGATTSLQVLVKKKDPGALAHCANCTAAFASA